MMTRMQLKTREQGVLQGRQQEGEWKQTAQAQALTHHKDKQHKQQGNYHNLQSTKRTSKSHSKSQRRVRRQKQRAEGGGGGRKKKEKKRKENQTKKHHAHGETKSTN